MQGSLSSARAEVGCPNFGSHPRWPASRKHSVMREMRCHATSTPEANGCSQTRSGPLRHPPAILRRSPLALVFDSVLAGHGRATIWVDDPAAPRTAFLWDNNHSYYVVGEPGTPPFCDAIARMVSDHVARGTRYAVIRSSPAWTPAVPLAFASLSPAPEDRMLYALRQLHAPDWRHRIPPGLAIRK